MKIRVTPECRNSSDLKEFIQLLRFDELDASCRTHRNTRNSIYMMHVPCLDCEVVIKRCDPAPDYHLHRRISFYFRQLFRNYGKRSYCGAQLLNQAGIASFEPLAYWKLCVGFLCYQSCLMYKKIEADFSVRDYMERLYQPTEPEAAKQLYSLFEEMALICRHIHDQRLLHGDLVPNNFLVSANTWTDKGTTIRIVAVIDTDHTRRCLFPGSFLPRVQAMHCLRRLSFNSATRRLFLQRYFRDDYQSYWNRVLDFWKWMDTRPLSRTLKQLPLLTRFGKRQPYRHRPPTPVLDAAQSDLARLSRFNP